MKITRLSIVAVMLIIIVIITAGCSSKPKVGSNVSSSTVFSTNYKWIEYQMSDNGNLKIDKSNDNYQGSPAVHEKITINSSMGTTVYDIYFDTLMKNVLGGTKTETNAYGDYAGKTITQNITQDPKPNFDWLGINEEKAFTYVGSESITVPVGTYSNADLYTSSTSGITFSYWVVSGIPAPVKIQSQIDTLNLVGWG